MTSAFGPTMEEARRARDAVKGLVFKDPAVHTVGIRVGADAGLHVHVGVHPGKEPPPCPEIVEGVRVVFRDGPSPGPQR